MEVRAKFRENAALALDDSALAALEEAVLTLEEQADVRALLAAIPVLLVAEVLAGQHHFVSPNGELEAYTIPANEDGSGMKVFLHRANSRDAGALLKENNRRIC